MRPATLTALLVVALLALCLPGPPVGAQDPAGLGVQLFLDAQPGSLKAFGEDGRSAAAIIEGAAFYYGLSPRLHLALLEATSALLSDPVPSAAALSRPFGPAGPVGFAAQIDWASRELRAGLGPYTRPPTLRFSDGVTLTLTLDQAPEGVAVQRFLAAGRSSAEWRMAVERFNQAFVDYFSNELDVVGQTGIGAAASPGLAAELSLLQPWPAGIRVVHLAYFDHVYPTVDSGDDGNDYVVNYLGQGNVQYDGHDGHDYYFPDQPIGTPILAAAAGIAYARSSPGYGVVIIHPGGYETVYWHLNGFAPIFDGAIDVSQGVPVAAGSFLGTSGQTGFARGTPHLHFEVRRYGKQIDPYGWYGPGPDPCAAYAGCLPGEWLWSPSLSGTYDFTPPDAPANPPGVDPPPAADTTPPMAAISIEPPVDLLFAASFDGHPVQHVGRGFPTLYAPPRFVAGRSGQAIELGPAAVTYPLAGNLSSVAGTISLWANLPASYLASSIPRHYLVAASANPDGAPVYSGTLALRRDVVGPDGGPAWVFWTIARDEASRQVLAAPDTLGPGWHHFAVTWDTDGGRKALYLNGALVAATQDAELPETLGDVLQLGRFTYGGGHIGAHLDDLAVYNRALAAEEIAALAAATPAEAGSPIRLFKQTVRIDTNAIDDQGGIMAVQFGLNDVFEDPQPYYDAYHWTLPVTRGLHELAVRFTDRAGNITTVTQTILLEPRSLIYLPLSRR